MPGYLLNRIQHAMSSEAIRLWAEGVATAEDIELGVRSTFGFRMPHEGPMGHYDLAGIWKWPADVVVAMRERQASQKSETSAAAVEKIRQRRAKRKPWFADPNRFDEAVAKRDREYVRRLKALYWQKS
jgi:3-hydroxyacyl-CoA dehydrogenase